MIFDGIVTKKLALKKFMANKIAYHISILFILNTFMEAT